MSEDLLDAAARGDIATAKQCLDAGVAVDSRNLVGQTPLHLASLYGNVDVVELLLGQGATVNAKTAQSGNTPLTWACERGHKDVVRLLLEANADIKMKNKWGQTAKDVSSDEIKKIIKAHIAAGPTPKVSPPQAPHTPPTSSQQAPGRATQMTAAAQERRDHHVDTKYPGIHFYGKPFEAAVTSGGQTVAFDDIGLTMIVPPGAVPEGTQLDLTVRPCLSGPFSLPKGYQPIGPVYLINANTQLIKEVKVSVEHCAELQHEEDCKNLVFLRASSTYSDHQYKFEEIPPEKFTFTVGNRRGVVSLKHFSFLQEARKLKRVIRALFGGKGTHSLPKGKNAYSLRLYRSPNPSPAEVTALFCITLMQQLYIKNLETEVRSRYPSFQVTVEEPVYLREEKVIVDIPSQITGWSVDCDRTPEVTRHQLDLPLLNPDYTQLSGYPPKIDIRVLPAAMECNQIHATSCRFSINGLQEAAQFTLFLPVTRTDRTAASTSGMLPEASIEEDGDTDAPLTEKDLPLLLYELQDAASKWRDVGVYLGFSSGALDNIQATPLLIVEGPCSYLRELLSQWLKWAPPVHPHPTVRNLVSALRRAGEERMANQVKTRVQKELKELKKEVKSLKKTSELSSTDHDRTPPRPLANTENIVIAARRLTNATKTWEDNVMVSAANKVASLMENVAELARQSATGVHSDSSQNMQTMVGEIGKESNTILEIARKIASGCTDTHMSKVVKDCVERISTILTQLDVGARAKATYLHDDSSEHAVAEAIRNLADNAENLQKNIIALLDASESACIRVSHAVRGQLGLLWKKRKV